MSGLAGERKQGHDDSWLPGPSSLTFPLGRVDVWKVQLDEASKADSQSSTMSSDEIARANRFHFEKDRIHFTRCRSALRNLLGAYLGIPPGLIRFQYLASGKPQLEADQNPRGLQFNVTHSGNLALIAVGSEHQLGVDIEKIRGDVDTGALAERFFSIRERNGIRALPEHLRVSGFFACWTRKESFLKATGDGLSFPLADFSVSTDPDSDPEIEEIKGSCEAARRWFLADLRASDGYRAALAVDSPQRGLQMYAWN